MDPVERWNNPRWHAVYGSLVAMYIKSHMELHHGKLPDYRELRTIVMMARGHADEVEEKWQELIALENR